jgi:DNA-directed RNA polymerase specialized sigma24 family protein
MISTEHYGELEDKYGLLIHKISHWISGDKAISAHEDNVQDLWVAAFDAIAGYEKKEKQTFEEFWGSKGFDKYLKTCLWNHKNNKGAKITKKFNITKHTVSANDNEEVLLMESPESVSTEVSALVEEYGQLLDEREQQLLQAVLSDPKYIKPSGKANVSALATELSLTWREVKDTIQSISRKINNEL